MKNKFILGMAVAALALTACKDEKKSEDIVNLDNDIKAAVEQYVPNVIYTTYNDLATESNELYELLAAAAEKGVDALTQPEIDAICAKFLQARQSWEESEAFLFGAATDFGIDPHIDTWPLDVPSLATALSNTEQVESLEGEDGISYASAKLGAELLGFHGIEFILFRDGQNRTVEALRGNEDDEAFNGKTVTASVAGLRRLLDVLREDFGLTGAKEGCGEGECGACTILIDGEPVVSCLLPAAQVPDGAKILTIEGVERKKAGRVLQQAYIDAGAVQCGFCIPGMILSSYALLQRNPRPTERDIRTALSGNLCRCTGYAKIIAACRKAKKK